jgi:two-component system, LytTR family, response regulator
MNDQKLIRTIIVDDERPARKGLRILLEPFPQIDIVGEAGSVTEAIQLIEKLKPDLIFLDIQMPGQSGFDLLTRVEVNFFVIFVTAYDEFAIRALKMNALDYLLKPVSHEAIKDSISKLGDNAVSTVLKINNLGYTDRIFLKADQAFHMVKLHQIISIRAEGDYSKISMLPDQSLIVLKTLKDWEQILPEDYFVRINRSVIINIDYVIKIEKGFNDSSYIFLKHTKEPFSVSPNYASKLKEIAPFIK